MAIAILISIVKGINVVAMHATVNALLVARGLVVGRVHVKAVRMECVEDVVVPPPVTLVLATLVVATLVVATAVVATAVVVTKDPDRVRIPTPIKVQQ